MSYNHTHTKTSSKSEKNLIITIFLNFIISFIEIIGGLLSGSLSLISDALHNFSDGIAIIITYIAMKLSKKPKTFKYTFGFKRAEIIAAIINSSTLIIISFFLIKEAVERINHPSPITGSIMLIVATIGLIANIVGTLLLKKGSKNSLNMRAAYFHLLSDAISSLAVVIGAVFIIFFNIYWLDPLMTIVISIYILKEAYIIAKEAVEVLMMSVPDGIDIQEMKQEIESKAGVINLHHLHLWKLNDKDIHFEAHIEVNDSLISSLMPLKIGIEEILKSKFDVNHTTIQFEVSQCENILV
ncbi:MAG: cation diffusion facilitator family transporter [Candidatus Kapabacteria bacterium]|nr:cation diffusion facilitator family transporter [Candidatus Kapabacteria bacterium]